ncbi:MAG: c-type cytochrome [Ignavibacteria bacterium]|nr:c-type cytochrome [Ignavibacteria bacterium]
MKNVVVLLVLSCLLVLNSCSDTTTTPTTPVVYDSTLYSLDFQGLPVIAAPPDNRLTVQGVRLGKMLFFETMLSKNGTQSCATCHQQKDGFSDIRQFSIGVENKPGKRQAMALFNLAFHKNGLFWDGRAASIREQSLKPIQDPLEMNETLENVVQKLSASQTYRDQFIRAFGSDTITPLKISLALEQFEFTLISGNSLYDKSVRKEVVLTAEQERGRKLFFTEFDPTGKVKGAECFHCHGGPDFSNHDYINNGLDMEANFSDVGRFEVTKNPRDRAKFKVTSLRNIAVTPPYMHDGRFKTLEEVVNHYNTGTKNSSTIDILMQYNLQPGGLGLSEQDKSDLVAFLKTLTDETFLSNTSFAAP